MCSCSQKKKCALRISFPVRKLNLNPALRSEKKKFEVKMGSKSPAAVKEEEEEEKEMDAGGDAVKEEEEGGSDGSDSPDAGAVPFKEGEKVLAFHGPRIYEAKIQKVESLTGELKFFVHYLGWNKNWDEWMGGDRLLKFTEENVKKQHELEKIPVIPEKTAKSSRSAQKAPKNDAKTEKEDTKTPGSKGKKRKSVPTNEEKEKDKEKEKEKEKKPNESLLMLQFPLALKNQLSDDFESITQLGKLVKLPRSPNVDDILKTYLEYRTKKDGTIGESVGEILKGLRCYFDKALPIMLLYNKERLQYKEFVKDNNVSPCTIYGAEHLLRLFVKLPELLSYVNMEEEALTKLQQNLLDFLKFMQKNQSTFFLSSYDNSKAVVKAE